MKKFRKYFNFNLRQSKSLFKLKMNNSFTGNVRQELEHDLKEGQIPVFGYPLMNFSPREGRSASPNKKCWNRIS